MRKEEERERGSREGVRSKEQRTKQGTKRERRTKRSNEQRGQRQHVAKMPGFYRNQKL